MIGMKKQRTKNRRPIASITADIHKTDRQYVFALGKLFTEAKAQLEHGEWLPYLKEIEWPPSTVRLYMDVYALAAKYPTVANLKAAPTALYQLTWLDEKHPDAVPLAIERLKKSVARKDSAAKQKRVIVLSPDAKAYPDLTEIALEGMSDAINMSCFGDEARSKSMAEQAQAIIKANPKTEEELSKICADHPILLPTGLSLDADDDEPPSIVPDEDVADDPEFIQAIQTILDRMPQAQIVKGLIAPDLLQAADFLKSLAQRLRGDDPVKLAADRAEARSRLTVVK